MVVSVRRLRRLGRVRRAAVGSLVLAGDLHVHDYSLFWLDVRENAQLRVRQWEAARAKVR